MSTEATEVADMAKKKSKHKKNKGNTDNTKKRKREERDTEQAATEEHIEERASKKHKKDPKKARFAALPVEPKRELLERHSPFVKRTTSFYLALSPCAHDFALEGLCAEHISPLLLTYSPPLKGVLLSYDNPRMSEQPSGGVQVRSSKDAKAVLSRSIDEYAVTFVWLTAEFTIFRPRKGTYLEGFVNVQNESMLGLVCYNYFNAMIERDKLPKDWKWVDDGDDGSQTQKTRKRTLQGTGHFEDGAGEEIEGKLVFRVDDFEANPGSDGGPGTVSIIGTLRVDLHDP
jgi:DNA-directed RNA polymerase I subunit RPA43